MNRDAAIKLGVSLALGVIFGTALAFIGLGIDGGIIAGMLATAITELFFIIVAQEHAQRVNAVLLRLARVLPDGRTFPNFMSQMLIASLRDNTIRHIAEGIEIEPERVPLFWTRCILNVDESLRVVAFIAPENWWEKPYSAANIAAQKCKAAEGKPISRVFVWKSRAELERLRPYAKDQSAGGIVVAHMSYATLRTDRNTQAWLEKLRTPDVALIDGHWAVLHFLNGRRDTKKLVVTRDPGTVKAAAQYLRFVHASAERFSWDSDIAAADDVLPDEGLAAGEHVGV